MVAVAAVVVVGAVAARVVVVAVAALVVVVAVAVGIKQNFDPYLGDMC